jgi:hypothetical protein
MPGRFEATVVIDRPIEQVFDSLADEENDPKFSPRVLEIAKTSELTVFNVLEGRGVGVLLTGLALRAARRDADDFAHRIKVAVEGS